MTRARAVAYGADYFDSGAFLADLTRRVAFRTESQRYGPRPELRAYLEQEMVPAVCGLGAATRVLDNPETGAGPLRLMAGLFWDLGERA